MLGQHSRGGGSSIFRSLRTTLLHWRRAALLNGLFFLHVVCTYCAIGSWATTFVQLQMATLDATDAATIISLFALLSGLVSSLVQPLFGLKLCEVNARPIRTPMATLTR